MKPIKSKNALLILLYISAMYNLRYYLTLLIYSDSQQAIFQLTNGNPRWLLMLAIYLPVVLCVAFGVVFVRYLSLVFMKSSGTIVRIMFVVWASVTLFFPLAVNKVYFTLPFAVGYTVVYLLLSWVMLSLETIKKTN